MQPIRLRFSTGFARPEDTRNLPSAFQPKGILPLKYHTQNAAHRVNSQQLGRYLSTFLGDESWRHPLTLSRGFECDRR